MKNSTAVTIMIILIIALSFIVYIGIDTMGDAHHEEAERPAETSSIEAEPSSKMPNIQTWIGCRCNNIIGGTHPKEGYVFTCSECFAVHTGTEYHEKRYFGNGCVGLFCDDKLVLWSPSEWVNWQVSECKYCGIEIQTSGEPRKNEIVVQFRNIGKEDREADNN